MSRKKDIVYASGIYLTKHLPSDYYKWTDDKLYQYCEYHAWENLEGADGEYIFELIDDLAWSVRNYIDGK